MLITQEITEARERGIEWAMDMCEERYAEDVPVDELLEEWADEAETNLLYSKDPDIDEEERQFFSAMVTVFRKAHVSVAGIDSPYHPYHGGFHGWDAANDLAMERRGLK